MRTPAGYFFWGQVVNYAKPPLSFAEQVALLESRGMTIPDTDRAIRYLSHINYYRLRAYWLPFETDGGDPAHRFSPGTSFDQVLRLYIFDRKFRLLVMEAIERVEVSFRTHFAYELSTRYGSHAHMDSSLFRSRSLHRQLLRNLQEEVDRSQETFIEHYRKNYKNPPLPPLWAACEIMSFGQLSRWFKGLKRRQDRQAIARCYGLDEKTLGSFMHHLTHVRNLSAHHSRLWNRKFVVTMTIPCHPTAVSQFNRKIEGLETHLCYNDFAKNTLNTRSSKPWHIVALFFLKLYEFSRDMNFSTSPTSTTRDRNFARFPVGRSLSPC